MVDLGDCNPALPNRLCSEVHRNSKAHLAVLVRRRHLDQGDIEFDAALFD